MAIHAAYPPGVEIGLDDAARDERVMQWIDGLGERRGDAVAVAYDGESPCGAAWTRLFDDREVHGIVGVFGLGYPALLIAVAPEHRGKGHGKKLIGSISDDLSEQGFAGMTLCVSKSNTPAIALYKSTGLIEHSFDDKLILMVKPL